jgi:HlyD family secretion protein
LAGEACFYNAFMKKSYLIAAAVALVAAGGGYAWWTQRAGTDAVQYRTAKLERGNLQATVAASGAVNPVALVTVGTQVSGQISELLVDFNSEVKAGQLLARIDPETFEYRVRSAQADVDATRAAVLTAQANTLSAQTQVSRAQVDLDEARRDYDRKQSLVEKQFIAQSEADKARALVNTSVEAVKAVQAQVGVAQAQVASAQANVAQREAALAQARIDLARTRITSPVNGIVIKRAIENGQTVAASLQAPELFVIAKNLRDMQVDAAIDESDVGRLKLGQKATFTVDAFPGQTFEGDIRQVRKAATNVANVVTYVAVVGFNNADGRLLPGMTANVRVVTDQREAVLKVPNSALRVRIAGVEPEPTAPASSPANAASAPATSDASGWTWLSQAVAQPAQNGGQGGAQGGGPSGGLAAMRERLITDLQLTTEQQAKLDAITTEMRPQFQALRDLAEDQRAAGRDKVMADMRTKIAAMLTPEQRAKYQVALTEKAASAEPSAKAATPTTATTAPANSNPATEFRNRVVNELKLNADQANRVDAIYAEVRPRFGALRDLTPEERPKARDKLMADISARIGEVLTAEQKVGYATLLAEAASRTSTRGRIYVMDNQGKPKALNVRLGITDGTSTELLVSPGSPNAALLAEGATIITGLQTSAAGVKPSAARAPTPRMVF